MPIPWDSALFFMILHTLSPLSVSLSVSLLLSLSPFFHLSVYFFILHCSLHPSSFFFPRSAYLLICLLFLLYPPSSILYSSPLHISFILLLLDLSFIPLLLHLSFILLHLQLSIGGGMSGVFDKFMGSYILLERRNLGDLLQKLGQVSLM